MQQATWNETIFVPSKIVCVGRNYAAHIKELNNLTPNEIVLFIKPNSSISSQLKCPVGRCRYETELTFVIQDQKIAAVGLGLDLTLVEVQQRLKKNGLPWEKAKAFDGSAVLTPFVDVPDDLSQLWLRMIYNDEIRQEGGVSLMLHPPRTLLHETLRHFSLQNGDLLMTGTPKGVGNLEPGVKVEAQLWNHQTLLLTHTWHSL